MTCPLASDVRNSRSTGPHARAMSALDKLRRPHRDACWTIADVRSPNHLCPLRETVAASNSHSRAILSGRSNGCTTFLNRPSKTNEWTSLTTTPFDSSILLTPRIRLETLVASHAAVMFDGLADPVGYRYIPQEPPTELEDLAARYRKLESRRSPDGTEAWLNRALIGLDGKAHGYVQATVNLNSEEAFITYFIFSPRQRQGYAREALDVLLPALREAYGIVKFNAEIDTRNVTSIRLVESLGFVFTRHVQNADELKGSISDEYHYSL
jgi:[ribosomal protein S5]-alanine N-acetyltransferase